MAIKLPKYQQQVGVASGAGAMQTIDPNAAVAPLRAATQALDAVTNMGVEFASKLKEHKEKGAVAEASLDKKMLPSQINQAKLEGKNEGISDEEMFDKKIKPTIDAFYESQMQKGYPKSVQNQLTKDYEYTYQQELVSQQNDVLQNEIIRGNIAKVDLATELGASDIPEDQAQAKEVWADLKTTMDPKGYAEARSMSVVKPAQREMQMLERLALKGEIEPDEYFQRMDDIKTRVKNDKGTLFRHQHMVEIEVNAKQNALIKTKIRGAQEESKYFNQKITKDIATATDYERLRAAMGDNWADGAEMATQTGELMKVVSDSDAKIAMKNLQALYNGDMALTQFIRENSKIGGVVGATTLLAAADMLQELSDTQGEFKAYEWWFGKPGKSVGGKDLSIKLDTNTRDYLNRVGQYMEINPGDTSEFINTSISDYQKWRKEHSKATTDEYNEFVSQKFKPMAESSVRNNVAPQQPTTDDKPPMENARKAPDGKWYIEKDGQYFEVK